MSTKCTVSCGQAPTNFHLYFDYRDDQYHLDIYDFEKSTYTSIPKEIMKIILEDLKTRRYAEPGNLEYLEVKLKELENEG